MPASIREQVHALLVEAAGGRELPDGVGLLNAGLDSVEILEFFAEVERHFAVRFEPGDLDLANLTTLDEIARLVEVRLR